MNPEHLRQRLVNAARAHEPSDAVPLGFEHRVLAGIRATPSIPASADWAAGLWRVALPCLVLLGITSMLQFQSPGTIERWFNSPPHPDELETVMLDILDPPEAW